MKRSKKLKAFYYISRGLIGILLIVSVLGIFLHEDDDTLSRSIFVATQSLILLILSFGPSFVEKKFNVNIPDFMESIFMIFVIAALLFGEIAEFFVHIPWWDDMLHTTSGLLVSVIGFSIINTAVKNPNKHIVLNPVVIAIFVFSFSMTIEAIWEIFEFLVDSTIDGSNMMRSTNSITGVPLEGIEAVGDTMHDIILTFFAALFISILGYIDNVKHLGIFDKWLIKPNE